MQRIVKTIGVCLLVSMLMACGSHKKDVEATSVEEVNEVLPEWFAGTGSEAAECLEVKLGEEFHKDHYRATAVLDNGEELEVIVADKGDVVEVSLGNQ